ncbi:hypothetical protein AX14_003099 [Amanita brunnescens Koide BX004]|nr:hypothetical protein AX14_003099 [Amanita brunnescens Koide BX004]
MDRTIHVDTNNGMRVCSNTVDTVTADTEPPYTPWYTESKDPFQTRQAQYMRGIPAVQHCNALMDATIRVRNRGNRIKIFDFNKLQPLHHVVEYQRLWTENQQVGGPDRLEAMKPIFIFVIAHPDIDDAMHPARWLSSDTLRELAEPEDDTMEIEDDEEEELFERRPKKKARAAAHKRTHSDAFPVGPMKTRSATAKGKERATSIQPEAGPSRRPVVNVPLEDEDGATLTEAEISARVDPPWYWSGQHVPGWLRDASDRAVQTARIDADGSLVSTSHERTVTSMDHIPAPTADPASVKAPHRSLARPDDQPLLWNGFTAAIETRLWFKNILRSNRQYVS